MPFLLASANLSRVYFPGHAILYSLLIHEMALFGLLLLPGSGNLTDWGRPPERPRPPERAARIDHNEPRVLMYLPVLGGGNEGQGLPGGFLKPGRKAPAAVSAPAVKGLSYPGPQPIHSNPPDPTNRIQTLLQPAIEKPLTLKPPLLLPNLVQIADAGPVPRLEPPAPVMKPPETVAPPEPPPLVPSVVQPEMKAPELVLPAVKPASPIPVVVPKMVLPAFVPENDPVPETKPPEPPPKAEPPRLETPPPAPQDVKNTPSHAPLPKPVQQPITEPPPRTSVEPNELPKLELSPLPSRGPDKHNILALTPMPVPREPPFDVPSGEARGRFAISPEPNLAASETEPGLKVETPGSAVGIGSNKAAPPGNAASPATTSSGASAGGAKDKDSAGGGTGAGISRGSVTGPAPGPGVGAGTGIGTARGPGVGSALGPGVGSGPGKGSGSGAGAGAGPGKGAFSGITIVGGVTATGAAAPARTPRPLQTAYGLTIVSTETSGGGLPYFGVFSQGQVYTVYLDMRQTEVDPAPSWTLEYAALQETTAQGRALENPSQSQQGLVLPFPAFKESPALPAELVRKYQRRMIIVYAVINIDGKMEQLSVKDSPDPQLNEPVLKTLSKWVFRPAKLNGERVPMKILMGIPLWSPD